jgi:hypothetical protein
MVLNTTNGAVEVPRGTRSHINTSDLLEPPKMEYLDEEPEIVSVVSAGGWQAVIGGEPVALAAFVALDDASMYGVAVDEGGRINLTTGNVELLDGFTGYAQTPNNEGETK